MVRAVIRKFLSIFLLATGLAFFSHTVCASGGGVISVGAFNKGAGGDTGSREWIELRRKGDLLIGRPTHKMIKLITVYAPGSGGCHLILRELKLFDGGKSLLFSAPKNLIQKTLRATIYLKYPSTNLILIEKVDEIWKRRKPVQLTVNSNDGFTNVQETLLAFSVKGLGLYWIHQGDSNKLSTSFEMTQTSSASLTLGGSFSRGFLPWFWSAVLLSVSAAISYWLHRIERNKGI